MMPLVTMPDGSMATVCTRGRRQTCYICSRPAPLLCDYPVTSNKSGTCDRAFCSRHGENQGEGVDYCLSHAEHKKAGE